MKYILDKEYISLSFTLPFHGSFVILQLEHHATVHYCFFCC